MDVSQAFDSLNAEVWGVWFLAGAALVFWMQAGFAMVEAGFTRAKNTGNIIMKNLMDFCIGTVMWFVIGASFMLSYTDPVTGEVSKGIWSFLGKPGFSVSPSTPRSTSPASCSTWSSVQRRRQSSPVQWQSAPSSAPTASTPR